MLILHFFAPVVGERHFNKYDPAAFHEYTFDNAEKVAIVVKNENVVHFPTVENCNDYQLLVEFRVTHNFLGRFLRPKISTITSVGEELSFALDFGVKGNRYIPLANACIEYFTAKGEYLELESIELLRVKKPKFQNILVVAAHPDDAEIAAFGLYSNVNSSIVTITSGAGGRDVLKPFISEGNRWVEKGRLRVIDSIFVPLIGGVKVGRAVNLGYPTGLLSEMYKHPDEVVYERRTGLTNGAIFRQLNVNRDFNQPSNYKWNNLVKDLVRLIDHMGPDAIFTAQPILDSHEDHRYSSAALAEALRILDVKPQIFLYNNHPLRAESFPFGFPSSAQILFPATGDESQYLSVYTHVLSAKTVGMKFIALEAMHDLRSYNGRFSGWSSNWLLLIKQSISNYFGVGSDYYRRAIRESEIFYQIDVDDFLLKSKSIQ